MNHLGKIPELLSKFGKRHKNIRLIKALEDILENIDDIPVEKLEELLENKK